MTIYSDESLDTSLVAILGNSFLPFFLLRARSYRGVVNSSSKSRILLSFRTADDVVALLRSVLFCSVRAKGSTTAIASSSP